MYSILTSSISNIHEVFIFESINRDFPFNIKIITKQNVKNDMRFCGPGIYSIHDKIDNLMVYIGIYTPSDSVIDKRFRKHLQTLTLRGTEVTFKSNAQKRYFLSKINNDSLVQDLLKCDSFDERLVKDRCVSHINKVNYAASNWDEFRSWVPGQNSSLGLESRFAFQFDKILGKNVDKAMLQNIEKKLISQFNPLTNCTYNSKITPKYTFQKQISEFITNIIIL